jgi:hypothetical protein
MTDEFTLRRATDEMAKADALLKNETLIKTLDALEASYVAAWRATAARDDEGRRICWFALKGAERFREDLNRAVTDGKVALRELAELDTKREGAA